jgi:hypothetical protein
MTGFADNARDEPPSHRSRSSTLDRFFYDA